MPDPTFISALTHTVRTNQVSPFLLGAAVICCHCEKFFIILSSLSQAPPGTSKFKG